MASTKPAPTGESATSAPADVPAVASDPVANQEAPTREQLLAAVEQAAYERAGHGEKSAVIEPTDTQGE